VTAKEEFIGIVGDQPCQINASLRAVSLRFLPAALARRMEAREKEDKDERASYA